MARPKKTEEPEQSRDGININDLIWMRDKFIDGLTNLESGVHELRRAYISHFNSLLPEGHSGRLQLPFFTPMDPSMSMGGLAARPADAAALGAAGAAGAAAAGAEANMKRKRKPHDPNAPKRALTSYFLFMQHNKPEIKEQHADWDAKQVAEESERRWQNISPEEKQKYEYMYQVDLARYYKQKEAYDAGEAIPVIDAAEATRLYNEHLKSGVPFKGRKGKKESANGAASAPAAGGDSDSSDDEAAPAPKAKRAKKDDSAKKPGRPPKGAAAAAPVAPMVAAPAKSPEVKKKGRKSKGDDTAAAAADDGKKKKRGRKSGAD